MEKLINETIEYWESIGFSNRDENEYVNEDKWTVEYMGVEEHPDRWRIDDYENDGHQLIFIDIKNREELESLLRAMYILK